MILEPYVKGLGYSYDVSQITLDAITKLKSQTCAMIITDLGLPDLSGQILAKTVRRMEEGRKQSAIAIIGLTASLDKFTLTDCKASGMDEVMEKPMDKQSMLNLLKRYL